jgi:hypothetical protein
MQAAWPKLLRWVRQMHEGVVLLTTAPRVIPGETNKSVSPGDASRALAGVLIAQNVS